MAKKASANDLGRRERQILEVIFKLGEASVSDVLGQLTDPPSYDSVRTSIRILESKGLLRHRVDGTKYVYRPTQSRDAASKSAISHLISTFFRGSASDAMAAMLDMAESELSDSDYERLMKQIERAKKEGK